MEKESVKNKEVNLIICFFIVPYLGLDSPCKINECFTISFLETTQRWWHLFGGYCDRGPGVGTADERYDDTQYYETYSCEKYENVQKVYTYERWVIVLLAHIFLPVIAICFTPSSSLSRIALFNSCQYSAWKIFKYKWWPSSCWLILIFLGIISEVKILNPFKILLPAAQIHHQPIQIQSKWPQSPLISSPPPLHRTNRWPTRLPPPPRPCLLTNSQRIHSYPRPPHPPSSSHSQSNNDSDSRIYCSSQVEQ